MPDYHGGMGGGLMDVGIIVLSLLLIGLYIGGGIHSSRIRHLHRWPWFRYVCWAAGIFCVWAATGSPIADQAHHDFRAHMLGHLLLGMLGPLLLVLAAPVTLLLRTLPVAAARNVSRLLRSSYAGFISHPVTASLLNIGGLWLLYTTPLYTMMHENSWIHAAVHLHVFLAGVLFTSAMIYIDPAAHRFSFLYRTVVFIIALAGHGILSKYIYASPPDGVPQLQAEEGAKLMYYGGDVIDAAIIFILCLHWYKAAAPEKRGAVAGR